MDFTLKQYGKILHTITNLGIPCYPVVDWIQQNPERGILLRHDVDRLPGNALRMAELESMLKIRSTYYFRIGAHTFKPAIIQAIAAMGHEIGYHYEDLSLAEGNMDKAIVLFEKHLKALRAVAEIKTIAMHGRPLSGFDNRDIWKSHDFKQFEILGEAFLSVDYSDMFYFTDTGRSWSDHAVNLRDRVQGGSNPDLNSSADLIKFIQLAPNSRIALVAHPERWNDHFIMWTMYAGFDTAVNAVKKVLRYARR